MIHIKCALVFCDEFSEYNIPDEELDDGPNASLFHFGIYAYQGIFRTHGIIPNGPIIYIIFE